MLCPVVSFHIQECPAFVANPDSIVASSPEAMMAFVAVDIELGGEEREALEAIVRSPTSEQRMVTRARVVLLEGPRSSVH